MPKSTFGPSEFVALSVAGALVLGGCGGRDSDLEMRVDCASTDTRDLGRVMLFDGLDTSRSSGLTVEMYDESLSSEEAIGNFSISLGVSGQFNSASGEAGSFAETVGNPAGTVLGSSGEAQLIVGRPEATGTYSDALGAVTLACEGVSPQDIAGPENLLDTSSAQIQRD